MKVIKPLKLGILHRTFEYQGRCFWSPAVLLYFAHEQKAKLLLETEMWPFVAEQLGKEGVLDQGMPKERGELLVTGSFYSPGGQPVPAGRVRVQIGSIDKTLYVFGQRYWKRGANLVWTITDPEPVTKMPITYKNAFGGADFKYNPVGKGAQDAQGETGPGRMLPNIEPPEQLIGSRRDKPMPAGFGPIDQAWPQRFSKCGTYDQKWYETRFPGLADDIDWTFFNTAPEDQQIEGFFHGRESFVIENMHPGKRIVQAELPQIRPRCFITKTNEGAEEFLEVGLNLDTVWLFPHAEKGVLIFHGITEVNSDTAKDIQHLVLAYENLGDDPRSLMHYSDALQRRLDKEKGALAMLNETDLIAEGEKSGYAEMLASEQVKAMRGDSLLQKKQRLRTEKDIIAVRDMIAEQGLDPDLTMPMPAQSVDSLDDLDFDKIMAEAEIQRKAAQEQLQAQLTSLGMSQEQLLEGASRTPAPRPSFSAGEAVEIYETLGIKDPELPAKMNLVEEKFAKTYRMAGHALPPVIAPSAEEAEHKRRMLLSQYEAGETLSGADLAGLDLSGLNLEGIDLTDALLEDALLVGTNLRNAKLTGIALLRSDLSQADLSGADLTHAGLGGCRLHQAHFEGAVMTGASLVKADISGANFQNAALAEADLSEVSAQQARFDHASLCKARFLEADLSDAFFQHSDLSEGVFYKTRLTGSDLTGARLCAAVLVEVSAEKCCFRQADLSNLRAAYQCSLLSVDFEGANLTHCNLRGGKLSGSRFVGADLSHSDFSEADLTKCDFSRAVAKNVLFIEADLTDAKMVAANLFESFLHRAVLFETDFKGANLYAVDFMKAKFRNTDVRLALTNKSTLDRWVPK